MWWKTQTVMQLLTHPHYQIQTGCPGGDVDTTLLKMRLKGATGDYPETLFIRGFILEGWLQNPDDCEVAMVEVSDGQQSCGGLSSSNLAFCEMYAFAVAKLRQAGFSVVPSLNDFF